MFPVTVGIDSHPDPSTNSTLALTSVPQTEVGSQISCLWEGWSPSSHLSYVGGTQLRADAPCDLTSQCLLLLPQQVTGKLSCKMHCCDSQNSTFWAFAASSWLACSPKGPIGVLGRPGVLGQLFWLQEIDLFQFSLVLCCFMDTQNLKDERNPEATQKYLFSEPHRSWNWSR